MTAAQKVVYAPYAADVSAYLTASGNLTRTRGLACRFTSYDDAVAHVVGCARNPVLSTATIIIAAWKE